MNVFHPLLAVLVAAPSLHGAVVIDNLAAGNQGFSSGITGPTANIGGFFQVPDNQSAFRFTTGSISDTLLTLEAVINVVDNSTPILATLSTGPGVPGGTNPQTIDSVTPAATTGSAIVTFTPAGGIALDPNTTYWVHLTVPLGGGYYSLLNTDTPVENQGWDLLNTWQLPTTGGWNEITGGPQARVRLTTSSPVPEPAVAAVAALGMLGLLRRRGPRDS